MGKGAGKGAGKGKGKGGCELIQDGCECLEGLICCVCLLLVLGPILVIVGVVFLGSATKDTRGQKINQVKDAAKAWGSDPANGADAFSKTSFSAQLGTSGCSSVPITGTYALKPTVITGSSYAPGSAPPAADIYYDGGAKFNYKQVRHVLDGAAQGIAFPSSTADPTCALTVTIISGNKTTVGSFRQQFRTQRDIATNLYGVQGCPTNGLSGSSSSNTYSTKYQNCRAACTSRNGNFVATSGSTTFKCLVEQGFARVCIRVSANGNAWIEDTSKPASGQGCFVPFLGTSFQVANYSRSGAGNAVVVEVRSAADPYLKYQVVTKGTGYFGLTQGQKVRIGLGCIVVGALLMSCWCLICWASWSVCCSKKRPAARPQNPVQGFAYDVANKYGNKFGVAPGYPVGAPQGPQGPPPAGYPQVNPPPQQYATGAVPPPAQQSYTTPQGQYPQQQYGQQQYGAPQYPPPAQGYPAQQYPPPPNQYPAPPGQYPQYPPQGQYPPPAGAYPPPNQ